MKLSVIIITKNEEKNISGCIQSVKWADEIVVVDNNSSDRTINIAKADGAKVFVVPGLDFSYLRNVGKEKSTGEWLLYLDADERITPDSSKEIMKNITNPKEYASFWMPRENYFFRTLWTKREKMIRLVKKESLLGWQGSLHESPIVVGASGILEYPLLHYTHNDISSMMKKTDEWSEIEAKLRFQSGHPKIVSWRFFRVMITAFWNSYIKDKGWRAGTVGIIESLYQSFSIFITYAKLWELQNKKEKKSLK